MRCKGTAKLLLYIDVMPVYKRRTLISRVGRKIKNLKHKPGVRCKQLLQSDVTVNKNDEYCAQGTRSFLGFMDLYLFDLKSSTNN